MKYRLIRFSLYNRVTESSSNEYLIGLIYKDGLSSRDIAMRVLDKAKELYPGCKLKESIIYYYPSIESYYIVIDDSLEVHCNDVKLDGIISF